MGKINREDMLELTRRMTIKRNCFSRIAGAYMDEEGFVDGTFNTHFLKLSASDQTRNLAIAMASDKAEPVGIGGSLSVPYVRHLSGFRRL